MDEIIQTLDDEMASHILKTIAEAHDAPGHLEEDLGPEFWNALKREMSVNEASLPISDGEMSRHALQLLAKDRRMKDVVGTMAKGPSAEKLMDPVAGISLATAVIFALKTTVEVKRNEEGQWSFNLKSKSVDRQLLKGFVEKLLGWMPKGPF